MEPTEDVPAARFAAAESVAGAPTERAPFEHSSDSCRAIASILSRIGDKWSLLVVALLGEKPMRFNELRRSIGGISQKMLTATLRGLERDGYVSRSVTPTIPPRVDYALTPLGREMLLPVRELESFARRNGEVIAAARAAFDARPKE